MEANNQNKKKPHPEKTGKVPASGVISETYKEEVNPQDLLESSSSDPQDPEDSEENNEDNLNDYPLEEADISEEEDTSDEDANKERYQNGELDNEANHSNTNDDDFLK